MPRFVTFDARQTKIPRRVCVLWTESLFSAQTVQTDQRSCTFSTFEETTHRVHASSTRFSPIFRGEPCFSPRFQRIHPDWKLELFLFKYLYINFHCSKGDVARVFGDRERRLVYIYICVCVYRKRVWVLTRRRSGGGGGGGCGTNGGAASGGDFPSFRGFGGCPPRHFRYLIILYLLDHGCDRRCANRRLGRWQDGSRRGPRVMMVFPPRVVILLGLDWKSSNNSIDLSRFYLLRETWNFLLFGKKRRGEQKREKTESKDLERCV